MCLMNFSDLRPQIYNYLGFKSAVPADGIDPLIISCIKELETVAQFQYLYKVFDTPPEFLRNPPYDAFLSGTSGVILSVMTLGAGVDRRINQLSRSDMTRSAVLDACANAYLEATSDEYERGISDGLTYRFCFGYGGSPLEDIKYAFEILHPEKIGVTLSQSCFMLPSKSMSGIIGIGKKAHKTCEECFMMPHCKYREEGRRCYVPEKK